MPSTVLGACLWRMVHLFSFMTSTLQIVLTANWHNIHWCAQNHTTNSCVWSTNACTAILEPRSKRKIRCVYASPTVELLAFLAAEKLFYLCSFFNIDIWSIRHASEHHMLFFPICIFSLYKTKLLNTLIIAISIKPVMECPRGYGFIGYVTGRLNNN